jgi:hypothetical protein
MKRADVAGLIFIASLSILIAYFVASAVIGSPTGQSQTVKTFAPINANVDQPDPSIFNKDAINPTVEVTIGGQAKP